MSFVNCTKDILNSSGGLVTINADATSDPGTWEASRYSGTNLKAHSFDYNGGVGSTYTDESTEAQDDTANDMNLLADADEVLDAYYFGHALAEPNKLDVNIGTPGVGVWAVEWQYYNGAWTALSGISDGTSAFTAAAGWRQVTWTQPTDWTSTTVNGVAACYLRAQTNSWTSKTTAPLGTQAGLLGEVNIVNTKTLTVTCKDDAATGIVGVRVRIENSSTGNLISNGYTTTGGIYQDASYNYTGDENVNVVARLKGYEAMRVSDTITTDGLNVPITMPTDDSVDLP
jgi:hypothetical protein